MGAHSTFATVYTVEILHVDNIPIIQYFFTKLRNHANFGQLFFNCGCDLTYFQFFASIEILRSLSRPI